MGIRINKAIGYGMTFEEFKNFSPLNIKGNCCYKETEFLEKIGIEEYSKEDFEQYSLNEKQRLYWRPIDEKHENVRLSNLFHRVGYDNDDHVLFIPCSYNLNWYRWDDDIDHAQERWFNGSDRSDSVPRTEDVVQYVSYGHYPYSNNLMTITGEHVPWDHFSTFQGKELSVLPEPPAVLTYWTQKYGLLSRNGVLKLKPMIATWWC